MKKKGYYEYSNGIYPRKLWVHIGRDLNEVIDSCFDGCDYSDVDYCGATYDAATRKDNDSYGVLVSFKCLKDMTMNVCCHEASHACDAIEKCYRYEARRRVFSLLDRLDCVLH